MMPKMLLGRAETLARDILSPLAESIDAEGTWPSVGMRALLEAGLGGLVVPVSVGGHGLGLRAVAEVCEVLGRACPSTAVSFAMHLVGSAVLAAKATAVQQARYLEPIASGRHLTTLALSEPGTGAHFYIPESRIEPTPSGFAISGSKSFVTNGGHADSYVMSVAAPAAAGPGEFSCVIVPAATSGLSWGEKWQGWGMRGNSARSCTFDRMQLDRDALLGEPGDQIWYVFHVVAPFFLVGMAGTYLGIAAAALDHAVEHLRRRRYSHTGSPLANISVLQHRVGTLWAAVARARSLTRTAADAGDHGEPDALPAVCSAKAEVSETAERVIAEILTLLGGIAYGSRHPVQRLYRDVRAAHVMSPTTDLLRIWTGRAVLGLPLLGDM